MTGASIVFPIPTPTQTQEPIYTEDMRKADEFYANGELAFKERRIDWPHWFAYQDVVRDVKLNGISYSVAMRRISVVEAQDEKMRHEQEEAKDRCSFEKMISVFRKTNI